MNIEYTLHRLSKRHDNPALTYRPIDSAQQIITSNLEALMQYGGTINNRKNIIFGIPDNLNEIYIPLYIAPTVIVDNINKRAPLEFKIILSDGETNILNISVKPDTYYDLRIKLNRTVVEQLTQLVAPPVYSFTFQIQNPYWIKSDGKWWDYVMDPNQPIEVALYQVKSNYYPFECSLGKEYKVLGKTVYGRPLEVKGTCTIDTSFYFVNTKNKKNIYGPYTVTSDNQIIKFKVNGPVSK